MTVTLDADGTYERKEVHRYTILDQSGVEGWAHVAAFYSPWYMEKPRISAKVINGSKVAHLDPSTLSQQPAHPDAPDIYSDSLVLRGPLPAVTIGTVIEETVVTRSHRPFLAPSEFHYFSVATSIPRDKVKLVVKSPATLDVKFEVRDAKIEKSEKVEGGQRTTTFEGGPFPALEWPEDLIPSDLPYWPSVVFSTGGSWHELAKVYSGIVEKQLAGVDFRSTVEEIIDKDDSQLDKIRKVHAWVKDRVRYVGIEFGESSVVPFSPDETVGRGFGDCKDQATLLVGLLRAAGLKAHPALLRSGRGEDVLPGHPALNVFDHVITVVKGDQDVWIDSTADMLPIGVLPSGDQGRWALVADPATKKLELTPTFSASSNTYSEAREVRFQETGKADVLETSSGEGLLDWDLRADFAYSQEEVEKHLLDYVEETYEAKAVDGVKFGNPLDVMKPFSATLEAKDAAIGYTAVLDASGYLAEGAVFQWLPDALFDDEEERKSTLVLPMPYRAQLKWRAIPPAGFVMRRMPEPSIRTMGEAKLTREVNESADGAIVMTTTFDSGQSRLTPMLVKAFRESYDEWTQSDMPYVEFEHQSQKYVREGKVRNGMDLLRTEAKGGRNPGLSYMRLALTLRPYLEDVARDMAEKAIKLSPRDPTIAKEYAHFVAKNRLGVDLGRGFDRKEAADAYGRAAQLDEEDIYPLLRQAVVLETNDLGERYMADKVDLEKAISIYDSIPRKKLREFDDGSFANNVWTTLYFAKKHDELRTRLAQLPTEEVPKNLAVINEAKRTKTVSGTIAELDRLRMKEEERASALESASQAFASERMYAEARELLERSVRLRKNEELPRARLRILEKTEKIDLEALPEKNPDQVAKKVFLISMQAGDELAKVMEKYLSKEARTKGEKSSAWESFDARSVPRTSDYVKSGVMTDIMHGGLSATTEGDDKVGYRVKLHGDLGGKIIKTTMYLVKEDGRYKVRAVGDGSAEMGAEALLAFSQKNEKRAVQWLNWNREMIRAVGGEDPLRVSPFARLWVDGKGDVELAAAALAAHSEHAERAQRVLENALAKEKDPTKRQIFLHALVQAFAQQGKDQEFYRTAIRLQEAVPESDTAYWSTMNALWRLERFSEYRDRIIERQKKKVEKERVLLVRRLADAQIAMGDFKRGLKVRAKLMDAKEADANDMNSQSWDSLFVGATESDVELARRSVEMEGTLGQKHTLACLYAELGKLNEASRLLNEIVKHRKDHVPDSIDYFIIGRMAEHLGETEAARKAYLKVVKPEKLTSTSTYHLAQKRLQAL